MDCVEILWGDHGAGNDPEVSELSFQGSTFIKHIVKSVGWDRGQYMGVMICLSQGGLRSLSASSSF